MSLTIYIPSEGPLSIDAALEVLTDDFIDDGGDSRQTVIDLRDALVSSMDENRRLVDALDAIKGLIPEDWELMEGSGFWREIRKEIDGALP